MGASPLALEKLHVDRGCRWKEPHTEAELHMETCVHRGTRNSGPKAPQEAPKRLRAGAAEWKLWELRRSARAGSGFRKSSPEIPEIEF